MKFLLFSLAGGLVMLVAVIALYLQGPGGTDGFLIDHLHRPARSDPTTERLLFLGFFFAFAVKAPMVPVHTWLPDAATEAPPATAVLLVGVLDKVGTFGMIRLLPASSSRRPRKWATPVVIVLAVISILYGALLAIGQTDIMRLIAYTSVSHFGFIVLGIFAMTYAGPGRLDALHGQPRLLDRGAVPRRGHARVRRRGSKRIPDFGGWQRVTPALAGVFLVAGLSGLALPGLSTLRLASSSCSSGTFQRYRWPRSSRPRASSWPRSTSCSMYKRMMTGPKPEERRRHAATCTPREKSGRRAADRAVRSCSASTRSRCST